MIAAKDEFAAVCMPLYPDVLRLARYLCKDQERAADLAQDTFAQALSHWHQYSPDTNARAWLLRIARNTFINQYRRRKRERRAVTEQGEVLVHATHSHPAHVDADAAKLRHALTDAVAQLDARFAEVFARADVDEMAYAAIAADLKIPIGTVMSRLSRARGALRKQLAPLYAA